MRLLLVVLSSLPLVTCNAICDCSNCCGCGMQPVPPSYAVICPSQCGTQCNPQTTCPCDSLKTTEGTTTIQPTTTTIVVTSTMKEETTTKNECHPTTAGCSCNGGNIPECPCRDSCNNGGDCGDSCRNGRDCNCECEKEEDCHCTCNNEVHVVVNSPQTSPSSSSSSLYAFLSSILCIAITRLL